MATRNADRHREVSPGERAALDLVAAAALPHEGAAGGAQQVPQRAVELRRHSDHGRFGFAQCGDLQEQRSGIDPRMIVRQEVERHRGYLRQ